MQDKRTINLAMNSGLVYMTLTTEGCSFFRTLETWTNSFPTRLESFLDFFLSNNWTKKKLFKLKLRVARKSVSLLQSLSWVQLVRHSSGPAENRLAKFTSGITQQHTPSYWELQYILPSIEDRKGSPNKSSAGDLVGPLYLIGRFIYPVDWAILFFFLEVKGS